MIVDCMLGIPLLHWASHKTSDRRYADIANRHAPLPTPGRELQPYRRLLRPDGSCSHIAAFACLVEQAFIYNDHFLLEAFLRVLGKHFIIYSNHAY